MKLLVKNGTVHLEDGPRRCDILIEGGRIAALDRINHTIDGCRIIDAAGLAVLPGMIDLHVHLDDTIGGLRLADTHRSGSQAAVVTGITTYCGFITQLKGRSLREAVDQALERAAGNSFCDHVFHLTPISFDTTDWKDIDRLLADGFRTFKFYTTYRQPGLCLNYRKLGLVMARIKELGARVLVHCEDDDLLTAAFAAVTNPADPYSQARSRPAAAEVEAVKTVIDLVEKTGCPCHFVHVSTAEAARLIDQWRRTLPLTCETGPQYLFLDDRLLSLPGGHRYICSPPLRPAANTEEMRQLALQGRFDALATDHCAFNREDKDANAGDFAKVPNGLAGLGALVPLAYQALVKRGDLDLSYLAKHLSLNPARIAGLYPRKGAIAKGADADLVMLSPNGLDRPVRSSRSDSYETYPQTMTTLDIRYVFIRGEMVVKGNQLATESPSGIRV